MVTGTDEHGEKIALSAAKAGLDPKAHCDAIVQEYKDLWQLVRFFNLLSSHAGLQGTLEMCELQPLRVPQAG